MGLRVKDLYNLYRNTLELEITQSQEEMDRPIKVAHVQRPGLSLAGYSSRKRDNRILVFGKMELSYLRDLKPKERVDRLAKVITPSNPAVLVSRGLSPPRELVKHCKQVGAVLFRSSLMSMTLMSKLTLILSDAFSPVESVHGTLIEAYGIGVLVQGDYFGWKE